jgi:ankyrin repeat protein
MQGKLEYSPELIATKIGGGYAPHYLSYNRDGYKAAKEGNIYALENLKLCLDNRFTTARCNENILFSATNSPETMQWLINNGFNNVNHSNFDGESLLMLTNNMKTIKHLFEANADLNYNSLRGDALLYAIKNNNPEKTKFLLENGAQERLMFLVHGSITTHEYQARILKLTKIIELLEEYDLRPSIEKPLVQRRLF